MSVPPLTDASQTSGLTSRYTHSNASTGRGEPVERMVRSFFSGA